MLNNAQMDFSLFGFDLFNQPVNIATGPLARRFTMPPFTVLDARSGEWQWRKRQWLSLGIKSELGRGAARTFGQDLMRGEHIVGEKRHKTVPGGGAGKSSAWMFRKPDGRYEASDNAQAEGVGCSVFDPVLCELCYRWFCPPGGQIVDCFSGGSVRGIVASLLGFRYWGCDLRREQIEANEQQAAEICKANRPTWVCGDALELLDSAPDADFILSCPPFGDLERYSDDPRDLSTMSDYPTFIGAYKRVVLRCVKKLKPGCFACFVVGDFRDRKTGNLRGFTADTINAFRECGAELYNDAVFVQPCGSLPVRVSAQFEKSRKLGRTHQTVLIFKKGGAAE